MTYVKFISVFNYGFDLLMINQWENVKALKCPIPTLPAYEHLNTTISDLTNDYTTGTTTTTTTMTTTTSSLVNQRPIYCIKDGAEILDDLKIRPVREKQVFYTRDIIFNNIFF